MDSSPRKMSEVMKEMSEVLLASLRVVPAAAEAAGFRFRFPELGAALKNVLAG